MATTYTHHHTVLHPSQVRRDPHTPYIGPEDSPWPIQSIPVQWDLQLFIRCFRVYSMGAADMMIPWSVDPFLIIYFFYPEISTAHRNGIKQRYSESSLLTKEHSMAGRQVIICHTSYLNLQGLFEGRAYPIVLPRPSDHLSLTCLITESSILASKHPP